MAITLVVETGSGLANANTYADEAFALAFAESVGLTLGAGETLKANLLAAMPYIESRPYQGFKKTGTQALQWPRMGVTAHGYAVADNIVPEAVKRAQVQAASMIFAGVDLMPTISGQFVTKEKVGPIETEYSDEYLQTADGNILFASIDVYLQPYINWVGGYRLSPAFGF